MVVLNALRNQGHLLANIHACSHANSANIKNTYAIIIWGEIDVVLFGNIPSNLDEFWASANMMTNV